MFKNVNKVVRSYIYWDLTVNSAWGLLSPVFAIFLLENIAIGNVAEAAKIAGFGTLVYWATKATLQMPIGTYLDKNRGERDDFWIYVMGVTITGLVPFGFLFSNLPWHIYVLQFLHAVGMSMVTPSSTAIFIRHSDKWHEAYESSLDSTFLSIGVGITGAIGGMIASRFGFEMIFILTGIFTLISVLFIFLIKKEILSKNSLSRNIK